MSGGPLQGIRVIECAGYLSAPTACYMLGDLGAEIIKIEDRVKGDPSRGTSAVFGSSMTLANGENILFEARIVGVADVVETMASHRPYRPSIGTDKALEEISKNKGILYDPLAVDACLKLFNEKNFEFPSQTV